LLGTGWHQIYLSPFLCRRFAFRDASRAASMYLLRPIR
jgi:hypothetical protein